MSATLTTFSSRATAAIRRRLTGDPAAATHDLAVMFTDIAGFTLLSEEMPALAVADLLRRHFDTLTKRVAGHGGTVDKVMGDGMLALWPGRDTAAALDAALAISSAIQADNGRRRGRGEPAVQLRIGLHAGAAVMAPLGPGGRRTPLGDTVNVAQRLEDAARNHGCGRAVTILVSDTVVGRAGPGYRFAGLGAIAVRGRARPVDAYRLEGA